jgi:hypothetical protein
MWVLEARKDAEKIWFPIVWETEKDASNVIDYNINEETTIDNTSVTNANNQTTTGMATLIYWVNAPKILEKTSVYQNTESLYWWVTATWTTRVTVVDAQIENTIRNWTLSNQIGNIEFKVQNDYWTLLTWLRIPKSWYYEIDIHWFHGSSTFSLDYELNIAKWWFGNDINIYTIIWEQNSNWNDWSLTYHFIEWDTIYMYITLHYVWTSTTFGVDVPVTLTITKL